MDSHKFRKLLFNKLLKSKPPKNLENSRHWEKKLDELNNRLSNLKRLEDDIDCSKILCKFNHELEKEITQAQNKFNNCLILSEMFFWWECAWFGADKPQNVARSYVWHDGDRLYDKIIELKNK